MQDCNFFKTLHSESTYKKTISAAPHGGILFLIFFNDFFFVAFFLSLEVAFLHFIKRSFFDCLFTL